MLCRERLNAIPFWPVVGAVISASGFITMISGLGMINDVVEEVVPSMNLVNYVVPMLATIAIVQALQVAHCVYCKCTMHGGCCSDSTADAAPRYTGPCSCVVSCMGDFVLYMYKLGLAGFGWLIVLGFIVITAICAIIAGIFFITVAFCKVPMPFGSNLAMAIGRIIQIAKTYDDRRGDDHESRMSNFQASNFTQTIQNVCDESEEVLTGATLLVVGDGLVLAGKTIVLCTYVTICESTVRSRNPRRVVRSIIPPTTRVHHICAGALRRGGVRDVLQEVWQEEHEPDGQRDILVESGPGRRAHQGVTSGLAHTCRPAALRRLR